MKINLSLLRKHKKLRLRAIICSLIFLTLAIILSMLVPEGEDNETNNISNEEIRNFQECIEAGNPVMESYPRQCRSQEGQTFVEELDESVQVEPPTDSLCEDQCGDGVCDDIVCLGTGCPCAEDIDSCPQDCTESEEKVVDDTPFGLANPASIYCMEQGGTLMFEEGDDGTIGYCILEDGTECEEWAYFRNECS